MSERREPNEPPLPSMNARELRALADRAASLRASGGLPLWVVVRTNEETQQPEVSVWERKTAPPGAIYKIETYEVTEQRTPPAVVTIGDDTSGLANVAQKYDALFWSEAAVEKFVLPYYASKSLWLAAYTLKLLSKAWYTKVPHPDLKDRAPADSTVVPFALAHTPDSDYSVVDATPGLDVLYREGGKVVASSLHDFMEKYHPGGAS